jgi:hypothetical protein
MGPAGTHATQVASSKPSPGADGYEDGADAGHDAGVLREAYPDLDEAGAEDEPVFAGADEDVDADAEADADVDVDVAGGGDVVGGVVGDVVGVEDVGVEDGDEYVLAGWDVPTYGDELGDDDGEAVGVVDADETSGAADAGTVAGDVCAAGDSIWTGGGLIEFTTKAVAPLAPTMPPRISASTSGFTRRRGVLGG